MQRILAIWLPNWPIQRLTHDQPELEGRPVILQQRTRRGLCVLACSQAAHDQGVTVGLPVAEATALLGASRRATRSPHQSTPHQPTPHLKTPHLETHDPAADRAALVKLAAWCHRFSPAVGLEEAAAPDTLFLNVSGVPPLFGGEPPFAAQVRRSFQQQRLSIRLGLAETVGAAWALAHFGPQDHPLSVATVPGLPLTALRLPEETVELLQRLGLERIGQLLELPRAELESRFGPRLLQRLDQALGGLPEPLRLIQPPPEFTAEWLGEYPLPQFKRVQQVVRRLVEQLCFRLAEHERGLLGLLGRIVCQDASPLVWEVHLFRPSADVQHVWRLVEMQLERLPLPGPATRVTLRATRHARLQTRQQTLFEQSERSIDAPQLAALVDSLAGRLGRAAVVRCLLQHDAQPERAFRDEPLVGRASATGRRRAAATRRTTLAPLDRPLRLLDPPPRLEVLAVAPDGPPLRFCYQGGQHEVARHWGPERIETGWWRKRGIRRDYYRVETAAGRRFWLFRCLQEHHWRLHGLYE